MGYFINSINPTELTFVVVENRVNNEIKVCFESLKALNIQSYVIDDVEEPELFVEFKSRYIHKSTNNRLFELICFRRYFLLRQAYERGSLVGDIVLVDSDVIVNPGVLEFVKEISSNYDFMGSIAMAGNFNENQISPHFSFWRKDALFDFTDFLLSAYSDQAILDRMTKIADQFSSRKLLGGISDMTLLYLWVDINRVRHGLVNSVRNSMVIDHNISLSFNGDGVVFDKLFGVKLLCKKQRKLYFRSNGELVYPLVMHFQGRAKILMRAVYSNNLFKYFSMALFLFLARWARDKYLALRLKSWYQ